MRAGGDTPARPGEAPARSASGHHSKPVEDGRIDGRQAQFASMTLVALSGDTLVISSTNLYPTYDYVRNMHKHRQSNSEAIDYAIVLSSVGVTPRTHPTSS